MWASNTPEATLPEDAEKATFTVSLANALAPGDEPLLLECPSINVSQPSILLARAAGELKIGGEVHDRSNGSNLEVAMTCLRTGSSLVQITLPVAGSGYTPLVFTFKKRCVTATRMQQIYIYVLFGVAALVIFACTVAACSAAFKARWRAMPPREKPSTEVDGIDYANDPFLTRPI
eukprot:NODE_22815_length_693_cov_3.213781.p1 GENE.NODE_22815_length_693_cov_3.213781~~NODE_22815_length_693_cov_3.213781.p1  ORF type:complete len:176 (-),score=39.41 NODE_22815_length_693_cov_3.213781:166-693(-)